MRRPPVAIAASVVVIVAALALVGWRVRWPGALFAASLSPVTQVGAAAGARSSPAPSPLPSSSAAVTSPTGQEASTPATPGGPTSPASPGGAGSVTGPQVSGPAAAVTAYFAAINSKDYAKAWQFGGRNTGNSYAEFVAGFVGTARDAVTVQSVAGDVVTARLVAYQADGTVKTFEGAYTVQNGVITKFDVQQVS